MTDVSRLPLLPRRVSGADAASKDTTAATFSRRVLIADDNPDAAASLALMLKMQGHEVFIAGDGVEALDVARRYRPDVAILDLGMPRMDGYEAARQLRLDPCGRDLLLIALSGWTQGTRDTPMPYFDAHRVKPIDLNDLSALLSQRVAARSQPVTTYSSSGG